MKNDLNPEAVLDYWFGPVDPPDDNYRRLWFSGGETVDNEIQARFLPMHQQVRHGLPKGWEGNARSILAAIIVIDQFSRNLFRGKAEAFAWDSLGVDWAQQGWQSGLFGTLTPVQQAFSLLPLIHAENLALHDLAISHYEQLTTLQADQDSILTAFLSSAKEHRAIIERFGRYPHRNAVLNRLSTAAEKEYLNSGGARFGQ